MPNWINSTDKGLNDGRDQLLERRYSRGAIRRSVDKCIMVMIRQCSCGAKAALALE